MESYCAVFTLKPDRVDAYRALHAACWPEQARALRACGAENLEIFLRGTLCVIVYNCADFEGFLAALAQNPVNARWQKLMDGCFETAVALEGEGKIPTLDKVFSLREVLDRNEKTERMDSYETSYQ